MKKILLSIICFIIAFSLVSCKKNIAETSSPPVLIAHSGGQIYGYRLTNSKEALDLAYKNDFRHIELDFEITSDGEYVLLHDWESMAQRMLGKSGILTKDEFLNSKVFRDLTLLDFDGLLKWLKKHNDCYIITDVKCDNIPFIDKIASLEKLKDNFIIQAYSYDEYYYAKSKGIKNVILTLYRFLPVESEVIEFAKENNPWAITLSEFYATESLLTALKENGTPTYMHTVNELYIYEKYRDLGLHGIYTNYFEANHWE
ncbi:MAG: amidohydrolase [Clostridia bacterium]|nr:amidohydrolase [Clostridia bacterium]